FIQLSRLWSLGFDLGLPQCNPSCLKLFGRHQCSAYCANASGIGPEDLYFFRIQRLRGCDVLILRPEPEYFPFWIDLFFPGVTVELHEAAKLKGVPLHDVHESGLGRRLPRRVEGLTSLARGVNKIRRIVPDELVQVGAIRAEPTEILLEPPPREGIVPAPA